jgi:hypothetical protein
MTKLQLMISLIKANHRSIAEMECNVVPIVGVSDKEALEVPAVLLSTAPHDHEVALVLLCHGATSIHMLMSNYRATMLLKNEADGRVDAIEVGDAVGMMTLIRLTRETLFIINRTWFIFL